MLCMPLTVHYNHHSYILYTVAVSLLYCELIARTIHFSIPQMRIAGKEALERIVTSPHPLCSGCRCRLHAANTWSASVSSCVVSENAMRLWLTVVRYATESNWIIPKWRPGPRLTTRKTRDLPRVAKQKDHVMLIQSEHSRTGRNL